MDSFFVRRSARWSVAGAACLLVGLLVLPRVLVAQTLDTEFIDVNEIRTIIVNSGEIGQDPRINAGFGFFPATSQNNYIFGTGLMVGGLVNGVKTVSLVYDTRGGASEFAPGRAPVNGGGADDILCSNRPEDLANWYPEFSDASGNPIVFSQKDCVVIYNDSNQGAYEVQTPVGLEVKQRTMAFTFGLLSRVIFVVWDITNTGANAMEEAFVAINTDMDIGDAGDDLCSAIPIVPPGANNASQDTIETNIGFCWSNGFNEPAFDPNPPGFVGITFFQGPVSDTGDTLGLGQFTMFINSGNPDDPDTDADQYDLLAAIGNRFPFINTNPDDVRFTEISGPITFAPGQTQRVVVGYIFADVSVPTTSLPTSPSRCFPVVGAPCNLPDPNNPALAELIRVQQAAQVVFDANFLVPQPPEKPGLTLIPGDRQVTVVWEDVSQVPDPFFNIAGDPANPAFDPLFRQFDFEGFVVVRSTSGLTTDVDTIATFDIANAVATIEDTTLQSFTIGDSVVELVTGVRNIITLPNTGLQFSFVDRNLINGIVYFYDVVPFDFNPSNTLRGPSISLSAGISFQPQGEHAVRPRSDATSFRAATATFEPLKADGSVCDATEPTATVDPATGAYTDLIDCSNAVIQATLTPLRDENIPSGEFFFVIDSVLPGDSFDPTGGNTDTGEPGYVVAEGLNVVWFHWEDATGAPASAIQPTVGSFTQGELFVAPRFNVGTQAPVAFSFDSDASDIGGDLAGNLVIAMDFAHIEDLTVNGQSVGLLQLGGESAAESRPHAVTNSALADLVLISTDRKVGAFRDYALTGGAYSAGPASFELTWSGSGGSLSGTMRRLPGGEVVPLGGQPKGPDNPSTPGDQISGYNWGFISGTPDNVEPTESCIAAVFGEAGGECGTVKEQIYPGAGPLTNTINLNAGDSFALLVPGNALYIEGLRQVPADGDVWVVRTETGGDRPGHGRDPQPADEEAGIPEGDPFTGPFVYIDSNQGFIPEIAPFEPSLVNVYPGARWRLTIGGGSNDPGAADLSRIKTVPNPYLANASWDFSQSNQRVEFINLPPECTIRIYTISGNLVRVIEHTNGSGTEAWDLRTRFNLKAASGTYYWHVTTPDGRTALGLLSIIQNAIGLP